MKRILILVVMATLVTACQGQGHILNGKLRDTIFSVEQRKSGALVMWMTHDDVGNYCTLDPALGQKALQAFNRGGSVIVTYSSVTTGSAEAPWFGETCNTDGRTTNYVIKDIQPTEDAA